MKRKRRGFRYAGSSGDGCEAEAERGDVWKRLVTAALVGPRLPWGQIASSGGFFSVGASGVPGWNLR